MLIEYRRDKKFPKCESKNSKMDLMRGDRKQKTVLFLHVVYAFYLVCCIL